VGVEALLATVVSSKLRGVIAHARQVVRDARNTRLRWDDIADVVRSVPTAGELSRDPLEALGLRLDDLGAEGGPVRLIGPTRYLNNAQAVVTHSIDDATPHLPMCLDALDRYGVKATVFVNTALSSALPLWPRLRRAVACGHEIGAHSRRHRCHTRDTVVGCFGALSRYEVAGSRDDILARSGQPYVWTWAYPCGNCADFAFVQRKLAIAGYIAARAYPDERHGRHLVPDLQTFDANPLAARYTQAVQKGYVTADGCVVSGRTDVGAVNGKFDEVYAVGGVYSFVSHPQWLEYGPDRFYERHLAHIGGRGDVWYVPMGPLYAYHVLRSRTSVAVLTAKGVRARFAVVNRLDPRIYNGSVTLEFQCRQPVHVSADGKKLPALSSAPVDSWVGECVQRQGDRLWVTIRPNTILEFS